MKLNPFFSLLLFLLAACESPTAIDILPTPNPNLNDPETMVSQLRWLEIVLDSPQGLYPASPKRTEGNLTIEDVDLDGQGELWARVDIEALGKLPRIRIEQDGLPPVLEIRLAGIARSDGKSAIAAGRLLPKPLFVEGDIPSIEVSFNIKPLYLPPQVTQVHPEDGEKDLPSDKISSVVVIFSKLMNPQSITKAGAFVVVRVEEQQETLVPAAAIRVTTLDSQTRSEYELKSKLVEGTYSVRISPEARDASGRSLDQVPTLLGDQGFSSYFVVSNLLIPHFLLPRQRF